MEKDKSHQGAHSKDVPDQFRLFVVRFDGYDAAFNLRLKLPFLY